MGLVELIDFVRLEAGLAARGVANPDPDSESGDGNSCFASKVGESALGYPGYRRPTSVSRESLASFSCIGVDPIPDVSVCMPSMSSTGLRSAPPRSNIIPHKLGIAPSSEDLVFEIYVGHVVRSWTWQLVKWTVVTRSREAIGLARSSGGGRGAFAGNATKCLSNERVDAFRASKTSIIDDPEAAVLLPREVAQEMIFWVDIEAKRL
ncbi:uncharacterized protein N0V89_005568 [Didymosphaeria variabile]|uniref:Uncharacterized protein n=1 Tax=Didymosphaeria variabile TaxID=1932322 RepID=A0A9W8XN54_9PLEO|nr:uncharacterized protein N0V89_005568 [Didymosphaeria variabile]KAJ4353838.1 hypothetical protein N0V89_005568 [Didymosphaeria variabile]